MLTNSLHVLKLFVCFIFIFILGSCNTDPNGNSLGPIYIISWFEIKIHAQHLETNKDSSRIISDYNFHSYSETLAIWSSPYSFSMNASFGSNSHKYYISASGEISQDKKKLSNFKCIYSRSENTYPMDRNENADFEINNIPFYSETDHPEVVYGSRKTVQYMITGENAKQFLKVNKYIFSYTQTITSPFSQVEWKYNSTKWDNDSYILVTFQ
jgi:hypothetical protein